MKWLFKKIRESDHKRASNYELMDAYCYTVTYLDNEPAMCSMAWERDLFNGSIRLMTRFGVRPDLSCINFGKGMENFMRVDVTDQLNQQIQFCKKLGADSFFVSQESRGGRRMKGLASTMSKYTEYDWFVSDSAVLVTDNPSDPTSWQYTISNTELNFIYE